MSNPHDYAKAYLKQVATVIGRDLAAGDKLDSRLVELDIERCRLLANAGLHWAKERDRIQAACKLLNLDEDQRTRETWGRSIVTLRSYRQVGREWRRYLAERRKVGNIGRSGIDSRIHQPSGEDFQRRKARADQGQHVDRGDAG